jgi:UDP-N-acetylmuramoyl-tripeptide--D-alanyl-D-alanine ligase
MIYELYNLFQSGHPVVTDSRKVKPGAIFFALRGDSFDGNAYAAAALDQGAVAAVVDDERVVLDDRYFLVPDVLQALQALAQTHRRQLAIPVLAITGSNGKTTTKELVSRVLARRFSVWATQGNLNNHIGVPLTLLSIPAGTELAVVEMGASHRGEIASYCAIAEPDYGIITNIGMAHAEGFGGPEGIRRGKGELFDWLERTDGIAFYSAQSDALGEMAAERSSLMAYAFSPEALELLPAENGHLVLKYGDQVIHTQLTGAHNRENIAAALAIGAYFEVDPQDAVAAIESYQPDNLRSQREVTARNILYLDCYNANPSSTKAVLESFAAAREANRQKVLILGDMLELGEFAATEHEGILFLIRRLGFTSVYLVGELFTAASAGAFPAFPTASALAEHLQEHPLTDRAILLKGSRGIGLESLIPLL